MLSVIIISRFCGSCARQGLATEPQRHRDSKVKRWKEKAAARFFCRSVLLSPRLCGSVALWLTSAFRVRGEGECFLPESINLLKRGPRRATLPLTGTIVYRTSSGTRPGPFLRETRTPTV